MPRTKKQSTEAAVREIRRRTRRKFARHEEQSPLVASLTEWVLSEVADSSLEIPIHDLRGAVLLARRGDL